MGSFGALRFLIICQKEENRQHFSIDYCFYWRHLTKFDVEFDRGPVVGVVSFSMATCCFLLCRKYGNDDKRRTSDVSRTKPLDRGINTSQTRRVHTLHGTWRARPIIALNQPTTAAAHLRARSPPSGRISRVFDPRAHTHTHTHIKSYNNNNKREFLNRTHTHTHAHDESLLRTENALPPPAATPRRTPPNSPESCIICKLTSSP